jgi:superfamily II DNA or RNA helicase
MKNSLNLVESKNQNRPRCVLDIEAGLKKGYTKLLPKSILSFRPSQIRFFDKIRPDLATLTFGEEIIIQKNTGTGKTLLFLILAKLASKNSQVAIVVPTIELGNQTIKSIKKYFPDLKVNFVYSSEDDKDNASKGLSKDSNIIVIVKNSLSKLEEINYIDHTLFNPKLFILDESHTHQNDNIREALNKYQDTSVFVSFTATPLKTRIDKKNPDDIQVLVGDGVQWLQRKNAPYGRLVFEDNPDELLADKEILPIKWHPILSRELRFDNVEESAETGDFNEASLNQTLETTWNSLVEQINNDIINNDIYKDRHNFFVACPNSTALTDYAAHELHKSSGYDVAVVTAKKRGIYTNGKFIPSTLEDIQGHNWKDDKKFIYQIRQLREGYNDVSIDCVIMLSFTKMIADYIQTVGRGGRVHADQVFLLVVDILSSRFSVANPVSAPVVLGLLSARENELLLTNKQKSLGETSNPDFAIHEEFVMSQMYESFEYPFQATQRIKKDALRNHSNVLNSLDVIEALMSILQQKIASGSLLNKLILTPASYPRDFEALKHMDLDKLKLIKFNPSITYIELPKYLINKYQSEAVDKADVASQANIILSLHEADLGDIPKDQIKNKIVELLNQRPELYNRLIDPKDKLFKTILKTFQKRPEAKAIEPVSPDAVSLKPATATADESKKNIQKVEQSSIADIFKSYLEHNQSLSQAVNSIISAVPDKTISADTLITNFALFLNTTKRTTRADFEDWFQKVLFKNEISLERYAREYITKITEFDPTILKKTLETENIVKQKNTTDSSSQVIEELKTNSLYSQLLEQFKKVESFNVGLVFTDEKVKNHLLKYLSTQSTLGISQFIDGSNPKINNELKNRFLYYLMTKVVPDKVKSLNKFRISQGSVYQISSPAFLEEIVQGGYYSTTPYLDPLILITIPDIYKIVTSAGLEIDVAIVKLKRFYTYAAKKDRCEDYASFLNEISALLLKENINTNEDYLPVVIEDNRVLNMDLHNQITSSFPNANPALSEEYYQLFIKIYKNCKDTDKNKKSTLERVLQKTNYIISVHTLLIENFYENSTLADARILQPHLKNTDYSNWSTLDPKQKKTLVLNMSDNSYFTSSALSKMLKTKIIIARKEQGEKQNIAIIESTPFISSRSVQTSNLATKSIDLDRNQNLVNQEFSQLNTKKLRNIDMIQELMVSDGYTNISTELITALLGRIVDSKGPRGGNCYQNSSYFGIVYTDITYLELLLKVKIWVLKSDCSHVTESCIKELFKGKEVPEECLMLVGTKKYYNFSKFINQQTSDTNEPPKTQESQPSYTTRQAITQ